MAYAAFSSQQRRLHWSAFLDRNRTRNHRQTPFVTLHGGEKERNNKALPIILVESPHRFRSILTGGQKMNIKSLLLGSAAALIAV
ncbi:MAG: hypothetical protein EOS60_30240, partial [Mesorhizobium sp.]